MSDSIPNTANLSDAEVECLVSIYKAFKSADWVPWDASEISEEDLLIAGITTSVNVPAPMIDWVRLSFFIYR